MNDLIPNSEPNPVVSGSGPKVVRGVMQAVGGAIPFAGGILAAIAGAWSENEQAKVNQLFNHWITMIHDEIREKEQTVVEIMARIDLQDERISNRIESNEFQRLLKKSFRDWAGVESEEKRQYIRNILANAACTTLSSDDVVKLFLDWISTYSELHFLVIAAIYNSNGIGRGEIWLKIGKDPVRENSAYADLYKLLIRDLSMGGIIRQHREVDYCGNFLQKAPVKKASNGDKVLTSAFDNSEKYELTELGKQFVHYAMTDLPVRISFESTEQNETKE